jgi:hypothetical protein
MLGWLTRSQNRTAHVYRPDSGTRDLDNPESVSGDSELPVCVADGKDLVIKAEFFEPVSDISIQLCNS